MVHLKKLIIGGVLLCGGALAIGGCASHPPHTGTVMSRQIATDFNTGKEFYSIYVTEFEKDSAGNDIIKCYEVPENVYNSLQIGDIYTPEGTTNDSN